MIVSGKKGGMPSSRICPLCDAENIGYMSRCVKCQAKLDPKNRRGRSKKSRLKEARRASRECSGNKQTFATRAQARAAAKAMFDKGRGLRSYWCKTCKGLHLTKLRQGR